MALPVPDQVTLNDKYALEQGRVFLSGIQALVRLPMLQRQADLAAGLNTAGFISGYRGSPLGGLDQNLWRAQRFLEDNHIRFQPGVNEDMAMTAVWGSQQLNLFPGAKYDGVFAMWYGKGPGVDRCGDVLKHGNAAGTAPHGGVLVCAGDDHAATSSTLPHQSDHMFAAAMVPVLYPANVQEILDYGLWGWAMSRYSGCWVAFKSVAEVVESSASVSVSTRPGADPPAQPVRDARGRAQHPLARRHPRAGGPAPAPQGLRRAGLRADQPDRPGDPRQPQAAAGHHHRRQVLSRRPPGARRPRHRRGRGARHRHPALQGRHDLAAGEGRRARLRPRPRRGRRGRGEAGADREPVEGAALQLGRGRPPAGRRQVRRARRMAAQGIVGPDPGLDRPRARPAHPQVPRQREGPGPPEVPGAEGAGAGDQAGPVRPHALFLLGLPAQHLDPGARGLARDRRHRLPLHGAST